MKTSVCTRTRCGSETSWTQLCMRMSTYIMKQYVNFFFNFLKFFQKLLSVHIFINCTNLSKFAKFVKIVFHIYSNFIKLSNIPKIFWQASTKFYVFCICKVYTNSFISEPSFLNIFPLILKFPGSFSKYSFNFFFLQNFNDVTNRVSGTNMGLVFLFVFDRLNIDLK